MNDLPVHARSEENGTSTFPTVSAAMEATKRDPTIWKISFSFAEEQVRLVRNGERWMYESIMDEVKKALAQEGISLP